MPEFIGNMQEWLGKHLVYPKTDEEGRVIVQFIVRSDGSVIKPEIIRSSGSSALDGEALRVVKAMPKWKPGKQQGKAVNVYFSMPVTFRKS